MKSMVALSHDFLKPALHRQAVCIDATLGQGKDTEFFLVQRAHKIYAFEIQPEVLAMTLKKLGSSKVEGICDTHAAMSAYLDASLLEKIDAAIFNFGYYPGFNGGIQTQAQSSLQAVKSALLYLKVKGRMALVFYGHEQGRREAALLEEYLLSLDPHIFAMQKVVQMNAPAAPCLICIEKKKSVK